MSLQNKEWQPGSHIKSLNEASLEQYEYQKLIKSGTMQLTDTGYRFLNESLLGGCNKSDIITISGLSGTGKSTFMFQIGYNIATLNKNVRVLMFSFEVPGRRLAAKAVSKAKEKTLNELYAKDAELDKEDYDSFRGIPFDLVEVPFNINQINSIISHYSKLHPNDRLHVIFDHTLLIENTKGDNDMQTLTNLANYCNKFKKKYNVVFFLISQLNDSLLRPERVKSALNQYPNQTDIFGARAVYHASDVVIALVMPMRLALKEKKIIIPADKRRPNVEYSKLPDGSTYVITKDYGPIPLPGKVANKNINYVYAHSIKTRNAEPRIDPLLDNLKYSRLDELSPVVREKFKIKYGI